MMIDDPQPYPTGVERCSSGLTNAELAALWAALKQELPLLHDRFLNPDYDAANADRALKDRDGALREFIGRAFLDALRPAEAAAVYLDMKTFFHCRKVGLDEEPPPFS